MRLHDDKNNFTQMVLSVSRELKTFPAIIEKDYFVTLILRELNNKIPGLLFKGGTCLSKCFKIIDRFSEDIDLTLDNEHYSQRHKRTANKLILEVCDELGFNVINREVVERHSHANYNAYIIEYPKQFESKIIKPHVKIEMVFFEKAYPNEIQFANSIIGEYLESKNINIEFDISSFPIRVQTLERTFIDKIFAICDYYLRGETERNSRHIYDIHKIFQRININNDFKELIEKVRNDRKRIDSCVSAQEEVDISKIIKEVIDSRFYEDDYKKNTIELMTIITSYDESIKSLELVLQSGVFSLLK